MTAYPRDFHSPPEAAGFAPEPPGGFEPMTPGFDAGPGLWLVLILLLVAGLGFGLGWFLAMRRREAEADQTTADLHAAVLKAADAALGARSHELVGKAEALKTVIDDRLGPVLVLGSGLTGRVEALGAALDSRSGSPHGDAHADHGDHDHGGDHGGKPDASHAPATVTQVFVGAPVSVAGGHGDHGNGHGKSHDKLSGPEQIEALSKAVRAFHDYWSQSGRRITELRAARRALERRTGLIAAATPAKADGKRIWDR